MDFRKEQLLGIISRISPNHYVQAVLIILLFLGFAKIVDIIITRVFRKWITKTELTFDDELIDILHNPIFISVILCGLAIATELLSLAETPYMVTMTSLKTIAILLWAVGLGRFMKLLIRVLSHDKNRFIFIQDQTLPLFNNLLMILLFALSIYSILIIWKIDVTAWMASAGILGLAISFAAKDTLANLFAGVFIVADAPYKLGDFIVLDSGERGKVTNIGIRSTRLLTRDDIEIIVPNSIMGNTKIINEAGGPYEKYRIRVKVGVSYGSDIEKVHDLLMDIAQHHSEVCKHPSPRVRFRAFGDSSLDHELLCWVEKPVLRGRVSHKIHTEIYKRFISEGIEIPFPQRDIHIRSDLNGPKDNLNEA